MTDPVRVLIADDHPLFRDGLTALLNDGADTELAGTATTGAGAVDLARETQPDVVVMDLHMPGLNGIEATRRIVADSPHIAVLVLTMFDDDDSIFSALRAGARGYLLKGAGSRASAGCRPKTRATPSSSPGCAAWNTSTSSLMRTG
jgi:DNA-binding NarL/FixJ family response regulator